MKPNPVKVRIRDFQSISDLELEVSGFTCVTGPSNIGKTAIIRAISGALLGAPVVNAVRRGKKFCTVELHSGEWSLKWEKGERGVNRYRIPADSDTAQDKVGKGQIPQVAALGFESVKIGEDVIQPWLATQFEPIFLMNKSGPAVTDFLSEVSRLRVLQDGIMINVRSKKRHLERAKMRREDVRRLEEQRSDFDQVESVSGLRTDLEAQLESIESYGRKLRQLNGFLESIEGEAATIRILRQVKEFRIPADRVSAKIDSMKAVARSYIDLRDEAARILAYRPVQDLQIPEAGDLEEGVPDLLRSRDLERRLRSERESVRAVEAVLDGAAVPDAPEMPDGLERMGRLARAMEEIKTEEAGLLRELDAVDAELTGLQEEIDSIPVCPACKRPLHAPLEFSP